MADGRNNDVLRHSVLDRLTGNAGSGGDLRIGLSELRRAVLRDVESLLNTRRSVLPDMEELPEAEASLLSYGIPDLSQFSTSSSRDVHNLAGMITKALQTFEPRLDPDSIKVRPLPAAERYDSRTHLRIEAYLHVEPIRELIVFDTEVDMEQGDVEIKAVDDA